MSTLMVPSSPIGVPLSHNASLKIQSAKVSGRPLAPRNSTLPKRLLYHGAPGRPSTSNKCLFRTFSASGMRGGVPPIGLAGRTSGDPIGLELA